MNWLGHLVVERDPSLLGESTATFSLCYTYRYALTRRWGDGPLAAWVMLNPSTANAFVEDPTIRRCMAFARSWSAGGIVIHNLFALRSTDPKNLYGHPDPVGPDNDFAIASTFSTDGPEVGPVIAAWGAHGSLNGRAGQVRRLLEARGVRPLCLGTTKRGQPRHPLYVRGDTAAVDYRAAA